MTPRVLRACPDYDATRPARLPCDATRPARLSRPMTPRVLRVCPVTPRVLRARRALPNYFSPILFCGLWLKRLRFPGHVHQGGKGKEKVSSWRPFCSSVPWQETGRCSPWRLPCDATRPARAPRAVDVILPGQTQRERPALYKVISTFVNVSSAMAIILYLSVDRLWKETVALFQQPSVSMPLPDTFVSIQHM